MVLSLEAVETTVNMVYGFPDSLQMETLRVPGILSMQLPCIIIKLEER